ncbi:Glycine--tRNA ligase [Strongyloides ratti]|uniref:Glycine--tRNA ligase n=1 Tax=Strongyloides ratti TaxID=34506 RepID=A0A090LJS7_STRRB|nr:Glycine--tRNA ligase [Strongyloides ratti]CEF67770.1 Glycine--tRNA ligase [Strongyloides ratti]
MSFSLTKSFLKFTFRCNNTISVRLLCTKPFYKVPKAANAKVTQRKSLENQAKITKKFKQRLSDYLRTMATPEIEAKLAPLRAAVKEYADIIRELKANNAPQNDIAKAVVELKARKKKLEDTEIELMPKDAAFDRPKLEDLLKRRFFYDQSFAIYGGVSGLYDYGPMGCALKQNMLQVWRNHFIIEDSMLEVECSMLTPSPVFKASGHVDRFVDWMVKDVKTGECFRADHLIKNHAEKLKSDKKTSNEVKAELEDILNRLDGFDNNDMQNVIKKYDFKSPITGNDLTEPQAFNLMFPTEIGPTGDFKAYLRPETAQGIFVNFKRLLEFNAGKLPFAAAQIGAGFRNEISPRQGLIRVREFTMCEIEHFVDPENKSLPKFKKVKDMMMNLFSADAQMDGKSFTRMTIGEAVEKGIVDNETLGYYMARTNLYLLKVGVDETKLRFRQHMANEMAHYAKDCWDAEILTSYGWIECAGHADRSCYDLTQHANATNVKLSAERKLDAPKKISGLEIVPNKSIIGKNYKKTSKEILAKIGSLSIEEIKKVDETLNQSKEYEIETSDGLAKLSKDMLTVKPFEKTIHVEEVTPSVIEPSFGIGRVMYAVLEHSFRTREGDEQRNFLQLPPLIAPIKCSILPISSNERFEPIIESVVQLITAFGLTYKIDDSAGSIGRRYARTDEIGIPFGITVDFESEKEPHTVTLRNAATTEQVRLELLVVAEVIHKLCNSTTYTWDDVKKQFPLFISEQK